MNIFFLDANAKLAAQYHCNKHVVKMILESAQILSTAHFLCDGEPLLGAYKPTHKNHPSVLWASKNRFHYNWVLGLLIELCEEYTFRYNKIHKCSELLELLSNPPENLRSQWGFHPPPSFKPVQEYGMHEFPKAVQGHREYYIREKAHMLTYTNRPCPEWMRGEFNKEI